MSVLQERLLDAMTMLSQTAVINSGATLTIECEIIETIDAGIGRYKVKYAENQFDAYSNLNSVYQQGDVVFVLVPDGDLTKTLTIIGPVAPSASTYITDEPSDSFVTISGNLFTSIDNVELCTYHSETKDLILNNPNFNMIFNDYLDSYRNFVFTAKIKTNMVLEQQQGGNYGIILNLPFLEDAGDGSGLVKTYKAVSIDVNTMQGNPYNFNEYALQNIYFEIAEDAQYDTSRMPIITAFVQDFAQNDSITAPDIWITDIALQVVDVLSEEDKSGYSLTLVASEGNYFLNNSYSSSKTLTPVLKVNGKNKNVKDYECYWFVEDSSVNINSDSYFKLGGLGWKCLNKKTNVHYNEEGKMTYQYVTNSYTLAVSNTEVISSLKYKCVLIKDDIVASGSVCLKNLNNNIEIELVSATGTPTFVKNTGYINLIARIYYEGVSDNRSSAITIDTAWQRYDKNNNFIDDNFYEFVRINDPVGILDKSGNVKTWLETEIKFPCSLVEEFNTVNCSFYSTTTKNGDRVKSNLGTSSLIVNTSGDFNYKLIIENGDVLYKYDADGDSPMIADYDGPISSKIKEILPLSYRLFKNDGTELNELEYQYCQVEWKIPKNSMIKLKTTATRSDNNYDYVIGRGIIDINYTIIDIYNVKKLDNSILLTVIFNNNTLTEVANIKFLKDGESGTNGSKYAGIIKYQGYGYGELNTAGKPHKLHPVLVVNAWRLANSTTGAVDSWSNPRLDVSVYCDGNIMTTGYSVIWRIFDSTETNPLFTVSNGVLSPKGTSWSNATSTIVEAEIKVGNAGVTNSQEVIYAYYPIEVTYMPNAGYAAGVVPNLIDGFSEVLYASDGTNPKYDNTNPFAYADNLQDTDATSYYNYTWSVGGNLNISKVENNLCTVKPLTKFDNGNSLNYINVDIQITSTGRNQVNNLINQLSSQATSLANEISYNQYTLQHILDFSGKFSYNNYVRLLDNSKDLLLYRSDLLYYIDQLNIILRDLVDYCKLKNISISYFDYNNIYTTRSTSLNAEKESLYKLGYYINLNELNNLSNNKIIYNEEAFKNKYGVGIYNALNNYVNKFNDILDKKYLVSYNLLCAKTGGNYLLKNEFDNFKQLENNLIAIYNDENLTWLQSSHYGFGPEQEFINLRSQLIAIINKLFDINGYCYSYDAIKQDILDECHNLIVKKYQNEYYKTTYRNRAATAQVELDKTNVDLTDSRQIIINQTSGIIRHSKPIIMMMNRYELSNINGWDGNKLYIDSNNNEYLLAPQVGAGAKINSRFTGVVMGVKQFNRNALQHIGLFGYSSGIQSYFMNAEDGSVIMGKAGSGQLIADPSQNKALLYSSNYWINYGTDGKPSNYANSNRAGQGMIIDLTTPEIRFGNGHFYVTAEGNLHAGGEGDGDVGGWYITDSTLQSGNWKARKNGILLDAGNDVIAFGSSKGEIYSGSHTTFGSINDGFYLSNNGLSIGKYFIIAATGQATVTHENSNIGQWKLTGEEGNQKLASSQNGILLDAPNSRIILGSSKGEIYSGVHTMLDSVRDGFYLSNNGLSIGRYFTITSGGQATVTHENSNIGQWILSGEGNSQKLASSQNGILLDAPNSRIILGGSKGEIYSGEHTELDNIKNGFYLSNNGLSIGKYFIIAASGKATVTHEGSDIGQWKLTGEGDNQKLASKSDGILLDAPNSRIILGSSKGEIYSGSHTKLEDTVKGFYLSNQGLSISNGFKLTVDGSNNATLEVGRLSNGKHWTISGDGTDSYILYGTKGTKNSVYIGTSEICLGEKLKLKDTGALEGGTDEDKKWEITAAGDATFKSFTANKSGSIAGWTINEKSLSAKGITISSDGSIKGDGDEDDGDSWEITRGNATFNKIKANKKGTIAGWKISENALKGGEMVINSEGSIKGDKWSITAEGKATFENIVCNSIWSFGSGTATWNNDGFSFGMGGSGSISNGGFSLSGNSTTWGSGADGAFKGGGKATYSSTHDTPFDGKCVTHIKSLAVDEVKAKKAEIGYLQAGDITAKMITTAIANADLGSIRSLTVSSGLTVGGSIQANGGIQLNGTLTLGSSGKISILDNYATKSDLSGYAKTSDLNGKADKKTYTGSCYVNLPDGTTANGSCNIYVG